MEVSQGSGACAALCIRRTADADADFVYLADSVWTCDDWYTNGHFLLFDCLLTVFDCFSRLVHCWYSLVPTVYQQCTKNCQKTVKTAKMTIGVPIVTSLSRLYQQCTNRQKQSKDSQNSKNDNSCTNRHRSTKTVPTVYQKQSKDYQNSNNE